MHGVEDVHQPLDKGKIENPYPKDKQDKSRVVTHHHIHHHHHHIEFDMDKFTKGLDKLERKLMEN